MGESDMKPITGKHRGIPTWLVLLCLLALPASAWPQSGPTTGSPEYLGSFPSAEKVRADIIASAGDARPEEIEGRVEGRLRTLANALEHSWKTGYTNRETGLPIVGIGSAPPAAKRLHEEYSQQYVAIYRNANDTYPDCGLPTKLLYFIGLRPCKLVNYRLARDDYDGTYRNNEAASIEIAQLYFPEAVRELFVETSGGDGKYMSRHQVSVGKEQRQAEQSRQRAEAFWKQAPRLVPRALALFIVALFLWLAWWRARPNGPRSKDRVNPIIDIEDLYLFARRGRVLGAHERTSLHAETTTTTSGGGGYMHQGSGWISAPSSNTTTTVTSTQHQTFFIREDGGSELEVKFVDLDFPVRTDNRVAIVYAGDKWSRCGIPVAAVNLDTGNWAIQRNRVKAVRVGTSESERKTFVLGSIAVALIALGYAVVGHWGPGFLVAGLVAAAVGILGGRSGVSRAAIAERVDACTREIAAGR